MSLLPHPFRIVFDCDGVLLDTVDAKLRAFVEWVPARHAHLKESFAAYNRGAFGKSRMVQIRHFYQELAQETLAPDQLENEIHRFGEIVEKYTRSAGWLPGSREFLDTCRSRHIELHVLSGTPQKILEEELQRRDAGSYFASIVGAPTTKVDGLRQILGSDARPLSQTWMIGDGRVDREAAETCGVLFIYKPSALGSIGGVPDRTVEKLTELEDCFL